MSVRLALPLLVAVLCVASGLPAGVVGADAGTASVADPATAESPPSAEHHAVADTARLQSATGPNVTVRSGPAANWSRLDSPGDVRRAITAGRLPETDRLGVGDPLVVAVENASLAADLGAGDATGTFFDRRASRALNLSVEQTNPTPQQRAKFLALTPNTTRVLVADDTTYLVVDTERVTVTRDEDDPGDAEFDTDDEFAVTVALGPDITPTTVESRAGFRVVDRAGRVRVDDTRRHLLYRDPATNQTVRGVANLAVGLNVTVVVTADADGEERVLRRVRVPVEPRPDGDDRYPTQFAATLDLSDLPTNETTLDVRYDGESLVETRPELVAVGQNASVEVRETVPAVSDETYPAVRADVSLSRGGFVVLHRGSPTGPVAGVSDYLPPGDHENVTVYVGTPTNGSEPLVAVAHRDARYDHWFVGAETDVPYATNGSAVDRTDFAPTLPTPTPTASPTATPTASATATPTATTARPPATTTTPGFGPVAGLLALCAAGVLFARR